MDGFAYLPGDEPEKNGPLAHYLPPPVDGIASAFLSARSRPGDWVLDPFGAAPPLDLEMARLGYRVLVAVNNPVARFMLDTQANPPSPADLRAALSELAVLRKGDERLETHLQSLYLTECTKCRQQVPAEAFVWEREGRVLTGRIYHCSCGDDGEYPANEADLARVASFAAMDGMHRSRLLERVAAQDDPDRLQVAEALECYLPRAVYALITIINKLDGLSLSPLRQRLLQALLLTACDEACALWPHPGGRPRPKQLSIPPRFLEKNVWLALEQGVETWSADGQPVEVVNWPSAPGEAGGLCLFDGPMRDLAPHLKDTSPGTVVTVLPRPNQAFWTLSALWAGWLWGKAAATPFKSVLHRRRYDWTWHAIALHSALNELSDHLPLNAPVFAIVPEPESAFLSAALLAGAGAGFVLAGLSLRTRHDPLEVLWQRSAFSHADKEPAALDPQAAIQAMGISLQERGEPVPFLNLHAAGLASLVGQFSRHSRGESGAVWLPDALAQVNTLILQALDSPEFFHHSESRNPETGLWGLAEWDPGTESLPDRVEMLLVRFLQKNPEATLLDLETYLNAELPGLLTPSLGLIRAVLDSYALEEHGCFHLRPEDSASLRRLDLENAAQALSTLADRLGFSLLRQESPQRLVLWQESGRTIFAFTLLASAVAGRVLRQDPTPAGHNLLVLPGGRASLLAYKLERDPDLRSSMAGWRVTKFRALRRLAEMTSLTREEFEKELDSDPIEAPEQMKLF
jgi:hypothetical protein